MTSTDQHIARAGVAELARGIARGAFTPTEVTDVFLRRIQDLNPAIGAFVAVYEDEARHAARQATQALAQGQRLSPLHGIPFAVKDIVDVAGKFTTYGSRTGAGRQAGATAEYVRALLDAGMILLGKTHTVEFAFGGWGTNQRMGTPRNPLRADVPCATGGSSSGSGAAVGAQMVPFAVGTDTGGSIRIPSAFCGLTGMRPSMGRHSGAGVMSLSHTLDTIGPLARTVEDVQMLDDLLTGKTATDTAQPGSQAVARVRDARIGVLGAQWLGAIEPEVAHAYAQSLRAFEAMGAMLVELALPFDREAFAQLTSTLIACEGLQFAGKYAHDPLSGMDEDVRARFLVGDQYDAEAYAGLLGRRSAMIDTFTQAMAGVKALLMPTTPCVAQPLAGLEQSPYNPAVYTRLPAWLGCCALAVPNGTGAHGLPTSLQIVGLPESDRLGMSLGRAYQEYA
ncbi:amidase [Bordetella pertussis]|uniref:amidase n=1 Tax=Bordetella pertussis TaxID=520 RepID=UPI0005E2E446|nr:amidase [Bordetella pertussis]CFL82785.1 amidase [Bordetella pertussis]CFO22887.1 amidase [Bordetella pertussis]CFW27371.1 amidase [Bordetella pertussis]CPO72679.1 amidase [Bordetella pertussis]CPQ23467.1 amidase [Bordetella pertussis]